MPLDHQLTKDININWASLEALFPFAFVFDNHLKLQLVGKSLQKLEPGFAIGAALQDWFVVKKPKIEFNFENLIDKRPTIHHWLLSQKYLLKGELLRIPKSDLVLFVGSLAINNSTELRNWGLNPNDFALHDQTLEHLFLIQSQQATVRDNQHLVEKLKVDFEHKEKQLHLEQRANFDALTKLPNWFHFIELVNKYLSKSSFTYHTDKYIAFAIIDINNFKTINDRYGFGTGDRILQHVTSLTKYNLEKCDILARLSGNEFIIFFPPENTQADVYSKLTSLKQHVDEGYNHEQKSVRLSCSIGVTFTDKWDCDDIDNLRTQASLATDEAKMKAADHVIQYIPGMYEAYQEVVLLKDDLIRSIENNGFSTVFQPIVNVKTSKLKGFEALARWVLPEKGFIPPDKFIQLAEDSGLMVALGKSLMDTTLASWAKLIKTHPEIATSTLSMNVSAQQLFDLNFRGDLHSCLSKYALESKQILLEITETSFIKDLSAAIEQLNELKKQGFKIALDDFGTGYSSLAYLEQLPVDLLKIDRAFVQKISKGANSVPVINAIVSVAKEMNFELVAEGVEEPHQLAYLQDVGCDYYQGYYHSKPLSPDDVGQLINPIKNS